MEMQRPPPAMVRRPPAYYMSSYFFFLYIRKGALNSPKISTVCERKKKYTRSKLAIYRVIDQGQSCEFLYHLKICVARVFCQEKMKLVTRRLKTEKTRREHKRKQAGGQTQPREIELFDP
jgi:hypothetical protein